MLDATVCTSGRTRPYIDGDTETPNGVLRTHCARHYGEPVRLRRGACVLPGDTILVVHFTEKAIALGFAQAHTLAYDDLCYIAQWLKEDNARRYGITAVHCQAILAPTLKAGGFELHPFTRYKEPWLRLYLEGWIILFHPKGIARFARGCQPVVNGWQSLRDLFELAARLRSGQPPH